VASPADTLSMSTEQPESSHEIQTCKRENDSDQPTERRRFAKPLNPDHRHDGSASSDDRRHRRQRTAALEQDEEEQCAPTDADARDDGVPNPELGEALIPTP